MFISVFIVLFFSLLITIVNKNQFTSILVAYFISVAFIMLIGLAYITRISQYSFPMKFDYNIYLTIYNLKISFSTLSRLYNIAFSIYMLCAVFCVRFLTKATMWKMLLLCLPAIYVAVFTDPQVSRNLYIIRHTADPAFADLWDSCMYYGKKLALYFLYAYMLMPFLAAFFYYRRTNMFIKRNNVLLFSACIAAINLFVLLFFVKGIYSDIMFSNISIAQLTYRKLSYTGLYFTPFFIALAMFLFICILLYYKPFNVFTTIRDERHIFKFDFTYKNLSMVLHTYKNAFLGIGQLCLLAKKNLGSNNLAQVAEDIDLIEALSNEHLTLLKRTFDFVSNTSNPYKKVDLAACITAALTKISPPSDVQISVNIDELDNTIYGDEAHLTEVFVNLFMNSIEAFKNKTGEHRITVTIFSDGELVSIEVLDNGPGISKKNRKKIFLPFFSTKSGKNSGIGLNYVANTIHRHHGEIRIKSVFGEYTAVQMILPLYSERGRLYGKNLRCNL